MTWVWINYYRILIEIGLNTLKKRLIQMFNIWNYYIIKKKIIVLQIIFNIYKMIIHFNHNHYALMVPVIL